MLDHDYPFNDLPALPPAVQVKTAAVLRRPMVASRALAGLKVKVLRTPSMRIANGRGEKIDMATEGQLANVGRAEDGFSMEKPAAVSASKKNLWASTGNLCAWPPSCSKKKHSQKLSSTKKLVPGTKKRGSQ